jgi:hypothetical protein
MAASYTKAERNETLWNDFYKPIVTKPQTYEDLGAGLATGYIGGEIMSAIKLLNVSSAFKFSALRSVPNKKYKAILSLPCPT